jgi:iron complex outermembrane receptor protein/vitamin B12 transporter
MALSGSFVGRRDGSTFLSDGNFLPTMVLPNRNLQAAYQVIDLSERYSLNSHLMAYVSVSNLFSQHYQAQIGYPSLPLAFRAGMKFTFGGENGWWK